MSDTTNPATPDPQSAPQESGEKSASDTQAKLDLSRSRVRILVTHTASLFVFGGGALMILALFIVQQHDMAKDMFFTILPIGTAAITYWFAGRSAEKSQQDNKQTSTGNNG